MMKNKILLIGSNGQLGWELYRTLQYIGNVFVLNRGENIDFTDIKKIESIISEINK
jgi:dTDP-4-dehydrorhamnose reductase